VYLVYAAVAAGVGFLIGTPYALLDTPHFLNGVAYEIRHNMILGHPGYEGNALGWYLGRLLVSSDRWITLFSIGALLTSVWRREYRALWLAVFPIVYLGVMSRNLVRFERYLVPMIPFLCMLSGSLIALVVNTLRFRSAWPVRARWGIGVVTVVVLLAVIVEPFVVTLQYDARLASEDVRTQARSWILSNIPAGSSIIVENYGPPLQGADYTVVSLDTLANLGNTPAPGQYVVASSAMYARFSPDTSQGKAYARILSELEQLVRLKGPYVGEPDYSIEVYRAP
jgi:hypothetical protein